LFLSADAFLVVEWVTGVRWVGVALRLETVDDGVEVGRVVAVGLADFDEAVGEPVGHGSAVSVGSGVSGPDVSAGPGVSGPAVSEGSGVSGPEVSEGSAVSEAPGELSVVSQLSELFEPSELSEPSDTPGAPGCAGNPGRDPAAWDVTWSISTGAGPHIDNPPYTTPADTAAQSTARSSVLIRPARATTESDNGTQGWTHGSPERTHRLPVSPRRTARVWSGGRRAVILSGRVV
jgi:hypothetical protein